MARAVMFRQANKMLRGPDDTPEIYPLPVFSDGSQCISYWQFSEEDWARIAANGGVYLSVLSGNTQPPVVIFTENPFVEAEEDMADSTRITVSVKDTEAFRDQERKLQAIRAITQDPAALNRAYILIAEFHKAYEHPIAPEPSLTLARKELRASLIAEELEEFKTAQEKGDLAGIADALMDLIYVVIGAPYDVAAVIALWRSYGVAPHYMIARDGTVYRLVDDKNIAYHAGDSKMPDGRTGVNNFSIGVEILNTKTDEYTSAQYQATKDLISYLKGKYGGKMSVVGHSTIAPGRKTDPWNFDWDKL
jgi:hypothetical protein